MKSHQKITQKLRIFPQDGRKFGLQKPWVLRKTFDKISLISNENFFCGNC